MMTMNDEQLWIRMCNLLFEMEQRFVAKSNDNSMIRLHKRMMQVVEEAGYMLHNPQGESCSETRTDIEASILTDIAVENAVIGEVLKPVVYRKEDGGSRLLIQKGIVIIK